MSPRSRYIPLALVLLLAVLALLSFRYSSGSFLNNLRQPHIPPVERPLRPHPLYKPAKEEPPPPLPEYFPLAAAAKSSADLPPVPAWNTPPNPHVPEQTRLYIGFTRYWPLLQQVVVAYITAGWPPEDIYVVENTGTFDANKCGLLTSQNPFYLDYARLTDVFGVNVITTPSLQTFAQLQNFYISEAVTHNISYYFWGHMDVIPLTHEDWEAPQSLYQTAVDIIRQTTAPEYGRDPETGIKKPWALRFFSYDWLTLVNAESYQKLGGWDSMIGYYGTDCDMHSRIIMNGMLAETADAGDVYDVSESFPDLEIFYRRRPINAAASDDNTSIVARSFLSSSSDTRSSSKTTHTPSAEVATYMTNTEEDDRGGSGYAALKAAASDMQIRKRESKERNEWQLTQRGGQGEPYHYDADGWEKALQMTIATGERINEEKWGHRGCDLISSGLKAGDQWRVEHDWD